MLLSIVVFLVVVFRCVLASLYEALSVRPLVGWSVGLLVGPSVTLLSNSMKNGLF